MHVTDVGLWVVFAQLNIIITTCKRLLYKFCHWNCY